MSGASSTVWDRLPDDISKPNFTNDPFWAEYSETTRSEITIHVAILHKEYLELILNRKKTIESRFSVNRRKPYRQVHEGDIILLKENSGPIRGIAYVDFVEFFELSEQTVEEIQAQYGDEMQIIEDSFWEDVAKKSFATLIRLKEVRQIEPQTYSKKDRNAWVTFTSA